MNQIEETQEIYILRQAVKQLLLDPEFIQSIKELIDYAKERPSKVLASETLSAGAAYDEYERVLKLLNGDTDE